MHEVAGEWTRSDRYVIVQSNENWYWERVDYSGIGHFMAGRTMAGGRGQQISATWLVQPHSDFAPSIIQNT